MASISKIEDIVGGWLKPVPHLPKGAQKWIAENSWWIVLVGVIISVISLLIGIGAIFTYLAVIASVSSSYYAVSPYGGGWIISSLLSLAISVLVIILLATAISPLKELKRKGWDRLFLVLLVDVVSVVLGAILSFSVVGFIGGIIFGAIGVAITAYFVFEIRSYFGGHAKVVKHAKN